jgi:type IV pilus assembly protein PilW
MSCAIACLPESARCGGPYHLMHGAMRRAGVSMVELIVALGLGMIIALLAGGLLLASTGNYHHHTESAWLSDSGRYALAVVAQAVRQGNYVNWDSAAAPAERDPDAPPGIAGLDARSISRGANGIAGALPAVAGANGSDVLALRFAGSGSGTGGDGSSLNCAGFGVAAPHGEGERGWSIFYVATDAQGETELRCKYKGADGWGADAVVRGVDSFQVLYGVDTDTPPDGVPNTYMNASAVNALDDALVLASTTPAGRVRERNRRSYWRHIGSIKLALLLHGDAGSRADSLPGSFDLFGAAYSGAHGGDEGVRVAESSLAPGLRQRARQLFSATVMVRNRSG